MLYYIEELDEPILVLSDVNGQTDIGIVRLPEKYRAALLRTLNNPLEDSIFSLVFVAKGFVTFGVEPPYERNFWSVGCVVDGEYYTVLDFIVSEEEARAVACALGYGDKEREEVA